MESGFLDYSYYRNPYFGSGIQEAEWPRAALEAAAILRRYRRLYTVTAPEGEDPVQAEHMAICAVAEVLVRHAREDNTQATGAVTSASVGSVHMHYAQPTSQQKQNRQKEIFEAACLYLEIFRGVG